MNPFGQPRFHRISIEVSGELLTKLIDANKKVATLEGLSSRIPNMELFISMYVRKEALLSSQIEGTQCTLEDILNPLIEDNTNSGCLRCCELYPCE